MKLHCKDKCITLSRPRLPLFMSISENGTETTQEEDKHVPHQEKDENINVNLYAAVKEHIRKGTDFNAINEMLDLKTELKDICISTKQRCESSL